LIREIIGKTIAGVHVAGLVDVPNEKEIEKRIEMLHESWDQ